MKLNKKIFPEIRPASILLAIMWTALAGYIWLLAGSIFSSIAVIMGMIFSYLNIYNDCRSYYIIKEMKEDISRLEKEYQEHHEELERHSI